MTTKQAVRTLKNGDKVCWRENPDDSPTDHGIVNHDKSLIEWPDGQITLFTDDWAMEHVGRL